MSNLRFFSPENLNLGATIKLSGNAATHAVKVMRLGMGDALTLFCGDGFDYHSELVSVKKNEVLAKVKQSSKIENESTLRITLLQGISAGDRMDISLQKATELGVTHIIPLKTERSVVKLDEEKAKKRVEHWQNVVIAACEQSGRAVIPLVAAPINLALWLASHPKNQDTRITLDPTATSRLNTLEKPESSVTLLVGTEGGLTGHELDLAAQHGFVGVQLGKRILRTETAPLATIAAMQTLWGDF
ncbi:MAG: 16S rRNA (uracil(1498)-N(3))-methyltransferase [Methylophilaceae bacterium]